MYLLSDMSALETADSNLPCEELSPGVAEL